MHQVILQIPTHSPPTPYLNPPPNPSLPPLLPPPPSRSNHQTPSLTALLPFHVSNPHTKYSISTNEQLTNLISTTLLPNTKLRSRIVHRPRLVALRRRGDAQLAPRRSLGVLDLAVVLVAVDF